MVLITYFLMNDNHASDAWAFAGVLIRQAYALGLNRDPSIIVPNASAPEKQQRRKVWQAVFLQDTFLTVILKLPPSATHTDVRPEGLTESDDTLADHDANDTSFIHSMWTLAEKVQETLVIAELVKNKPPGSAAMDPLYLNAKTDVVKMVGILQLSSDHDIVARTRVSVLSKYL
ncbi:MAG: hypothetical protein LQ342_003904 [Letrouitia transgressa]|nr:MAG: hypothetical protein LQ342_003904 [Letrouitia transgressa]